MCYAPRTIRGAEELGDMLRSSREIWKFVTLSVDVSRRRGESFSVKHIYIIEYVETNDSRRRIGFVLGLKNSPRSSLREKNGAA